LSQMVSAGSKNGGSAFAPCQYSSYTSGDQFSHDLLKLLQFPHTTEAGKLLRSESIAEPSSSDRDAPSSLTQSARVDFSVSPLASPPNSHSKPPPNNYPIPPVEFFLNHGRLVSHSLFFSLPPPSPSTSRSRRPLPSPFACCPAALDGLGLPHSLSRGSRVVFFNPQVPPTLLTPYLFIAFFSPPGPLKSN